MLFQNLFCLQPEAGKRSRRLIKKRWNLWRRLYKDEVFHQIYVGDFAF